jgi:hypothetical protein
MLGKLSCYVARVCVFLITAALITGMAGCDGYTPSQNLEIRTWYDLDAVRDNLSGNHTLMNDLDSTTAGYTELASPTANLGKGWQPIGALYDPSNDPFTGSFDGQGYEIRDMFIDRPDEHWMGLFGYVGQGGRIEDISAVNATVTGHAYVGGLVGGNMGTVSNSYSAGNVTGYGSVGGLAGYNYGTVSNSYSTGSVTGNLSVGGLLGDNYGTVSNSYSTGSVTGGEDIAPVGGLVGGNDGTVSNSYSTGSVIGNANVGELVGWNNGTVSNSYSTGNVTGYSNVGGLVGGNAGTVSNSYSTGSVTGDVNVGGLVGVNFGTVSNSFWDTETSGQATSDGGTGKNTTQMQNIVTFSGAGWNIIAVALNETNPAYIWNIVDNVTYPFLSWQA